MPDRPRSLRRRGILAAAAALPLPGCATERSGLAAIDAAPRTDLRLRRPVLGAVFDARPTRDDRAAAGTLQRELARIYGPSIVWHDDFAEAPPGAVVMRFRIVALGAAFGARVIARAVPPAAAVSGPWGRLAAEAARQRALAAPIAAEGWWNGAAWVDVEIEDHRSSRPARLTIPVIAEHRESNVWGYGSGDRAARIAWERVAAQLLRITDLALRVVREQEAGA